MITRQNTKWYMYYAWQAGALLLLALFALYMVTIRPFMYVQQYLTSLWQWRGHRRLNTATALSLINAYSDRIGDTALKAFVAEQGEFDTYRFAIRPGYHPAKSIIVLTCGYDRMTVTTHK